MNSSCWRCAVRKTSSDFQSLQFGEHPNSTGSEPRHDEGVCLFCNNLLLIDDQSRYCILRIPNEAKKVRRRHSNKFAKVQNSPTDTLSTYAIYEQSHMIDDAKRASIDGYLGGVFADALSRAVSNCDRLKVTEIGISIELAPELRVNSDSEMCLSLKSSLRSLLLAQLHAGGCIPRSQDSSLRLNQNSDLYISFVFSAKMPESLEYKQGFVFSMTASYSWRSVYIMGRYLKLSRRISQSKWGFSDGGKSQIAVNTSIEEILSESLKELIDFEKLTFSSSGREDVDVRMLGKYAKSIFDRDLSLEQPVHSTDQDVYLSEESYQVAGRPFAIEIGNILNHHYLFYPSNVQALDAGDTDSGYFSREDFLQLFIAAIRQKSSYRVDISVLDFSDASSVQRMNKEVHEKQKSYRCVCYSHQPIDCSEYRLISERLRCPITLDQRTPVRVLHRRPNISRIRKIYDLMIYPINPNYFILDLLAQAGTYIKEFVHGDLGRTSPSLGELIQESLPNKFHKNRDPGVIIVQLDVLNIH
ncbi:pseudouridylate synthase like protein [Cryptosporidium canis]|uniref:tRNA pseudouridine(55) synthase n=1 Tax=Cryptosporidium canis TaxID=195482 RepID=A0ABQ8PB26_9CRYT|nr:pseudouridylate synthase like protein [Cryptosporidium canis]KAJ1612105.1 pseudouridylate synthase like protein [Cryptosporidium canis]